MDFTMYWFMLPVSTLIATGAMLGGIGSGAMLSISGITSSCVLSNRCFVL